MDAVSSHFPRASPLAHSRYQEDGGSERVILQHGEGDVSWESGGVAAEAGVEMTCIAMEAVQERRRQHPAAPLLRTTKLAVMTRG